MAEEMRYPGKTKGKPRMACQSCWSARPGQSWCNGHRTFHPISDFYTNTNRPEGVTESCKIIVSDIKYGMSERRRTCMICKEDKHPALFRGGINKRQICIACSEGHPGQSWCVGCEAWAPLEWFDTPSRGRPMSWCALCWALRTHNTSLREVLSLQGITEPECAVCFSRDRRNLCVDHDHRCCSGDRSCGECVRGILCRSCNRVEGYLGTSAKAIAMAEYMQIADQRWAVRNEVK